MATDEMRALAQQCISHPASRTTGDVTNAGMAIIEMQARVKALEEIVLLMTRKPVSVMTNMER